MEIVIATPNLPWPPNTGGNAAQFSTLECLQSDHQFTLVAPVFSQEERDSASELAKRLPRVKVRPVFCGRRGQSDARDNLWGKVVRRLDRLNRTPLEDKNVEAPYYPFEPLSPSFLEQLAREVTNETDIVQVEFAEFMPLGSWLPKTVKKVFVHHQVHAVYADRFLEVHGAKVYSRYMTEFMRVQEIAFLQQYDAIVSFSEADRDIIKKFPGMPPVYASAFPIPADVGIAKMIPEKFNGQFIFMGSEVHDPNRDALEWLLESIWPPIQQQLPETRLMVIGQWSDRWKRKCPAVHFPGFVKALSEVIPGSVLLVPLRIGSGIRTKILTAMAQGAPVISTKVGVEGLRVNADEHLLVAETTEEFVRQAMRAAQTPALWRSLAANGLQATQEYSPEVVRKRRNEIYQIVKDSRATAGV
jgi:glycosyltransferase involved in cell wall biosynthesis